MPANRARPSANNLTALTAIPAQPVETWQNFEKSLTRIQNHKDSTGKISRSVQVLSLCCKNRGCFLGERATIWFARTRTFWTTAGWPYRVRRLGTFEGLGDGGRIELQLGSGDFREEAG